jgi:hypothetical protein
MHLTSPRAVLYAPSLQKSGIYLRDTYDSELLYLGQYLFDNCFEIRIVDAYAEPITEKHLLSTIRDFGAQYLIVHLWKNEILLNGEIYRILEILSIVKTDFPRLNITCIGSIAASLRPFILDSPRYSYIDGVITQSKVTVRSQGENPGYGQVIKDYFASTPRLSEKYLLESGVHFDKAKVLSLYSSRGCRKACSFCSYNKHLTRYVARDMRELLDDISLLNSLYGTTHYALSDNNFGTNADQNCRRIDGFLDALYFRPVSGLQLSLNISSDGLDFRVVDGLRAMGVKAVLLGLESFNQKFLRNIFHKDIDISHFTGMVDYCEQSGIVPIISYILFHPWLTIHDLRSEIEMISNFGRYRLVHFLAKSVLQVIPGTRIERMLEQDGLLMAPGLFERTFIFNDKRVDDIYVKLNSFFDENFLNFNRTNRDLAAMKILEWNLIRGILDAT